MRSFCNEKAAAAGAYFHGYKHLLLFVQTRRNFTRCYVKLSYETLLQVMFSYDYLQCLLQTKWLATPGLRPLNLWPIGQ